MNTQQAPVIQYFSDLVKDLPRELRCAYNGYMNSRQELAFKGQQFVVYQMVGDQPEIIDLVTATGFEFDPEKGFRASFFSKAQDTTDHIGYVPKQLFGYPPFVFLPLHCTVRWEPWRSEPLSYQVVLRTQSRSNLHEQGVTYFESTLRFEREFEKPALF